MAYKRLLNTPSEESSVYRPTVELIHEILRTLHHSENNQDASSCRSFLHNVYRNTVILFIKEYKKRRNNLLVSNEQIYCHDTYISRNWNIALNNTRLNQSRWFLSLATDTTTVVVQRILLRFSQFESRWKGIETTKTIHVESFWIRTPTDVFKTYYFCPFNFQKIWTNNCGSANSKNRKWSVMRINHNWPHPYIITQQPTWFELI